MFVERALDACLSKPRAAAFEQITAVIKTFERPSRLRRLVKSIRRHYPKLKIIVVDDSRDPSCLKGVETIRLPFDSGISAGRNAGLAAVGTRYMLCLDDDFIFYRHTRLDLVLREMERNPAIDIMAGEVVYLPLRIVHDYTHVPLFPTRREPLYPPGKLIGGHPVRLKVPNFYIARTERIQLVGWDDKLKRMDHADFFTRAVGVLTSVQNPSFKVLHHPTYFNRRYMKYKSDSHGDSVVLTQKYYTNDSR